MYMTDEEVFLIKKEIYKAYRELPQFVSEKVKFTMAVKNGLSHAQEKLNQKGSE